MKLTADSLVKSRQNHLNACSYIKSREVQAAIKPAKKLYFNSKLSRPTTCFFTLNQHYFLLHNKSFEIYSETNTPVYTHKYDSKPIFIQLHNDTEIYSISINSSIILYDTETLDPIHEFNLYQPVKTHLLLDTLILAPIHKQVRICDLSSGACISSLQSKKPLNHTSVFNNLVCSGGEMVSVWDLRMGRLLTELDVACEFVEFAYDGMSLYVFGNGMKEYSLDGKLIDNEFKEYGMRVGDRYPLVDCDYIHVPYDGDIQVYHYTGKLMYTLYGHIEDVFMIKADGQSVYSCGKDGIIQWDVGLFRNAQEKEEWVD